MNAILLLVLAAGVEAVGGEHWIVREGAQVRMILEVREASHVQFASSLDGFVAHETSTADHRIWEICLPAQKPFRYFYVIDGRVWRPVCACRESDDFGSENCVYEPGL